MENYIKVLETYISKIANLNAISSRLIVDSIQHTIRDDYLYRKNDPYFEKRPEDLVDRTFLAINNDAFAHLHRYRQKEEVSFLCLTLGN